MVTTKVFSDFKQLYLLQKIAEESKYEVGVSNKDGSIRVDAKSFIGLMALDFTKPVRIISEDEKVHEKVRRI